VVSIVGALVAVLARVPRHRAEGAEGELDEVTAEPELAA
jgi:hypothetical protein